MFQLMTQGVIKGAAIPCEFTIPEPDNGEELLLSTVEMTYKSGGAVRETFQQVPSATACNDAGFTITGDQFAYVPKPANG